MLHYPAYWWGLLWQFPLNVSKLLSKGTTEDFQRCSFVSAHLALGKKIMDTPVRKQEDEGNWQNRSIAIYCHDLKCTLKYIMYTHAYIYIYIYIHIHLSWPIIMNTFFCVRLWAGWDSSSGRYWHSSDARLKDWPVLSARGLPSYVHAFMLGLILYGSWSLHCIYSILMYLVP